MIILSMIMRCEYGNSSNFRGLYVLRNLNEKPCFEQMDRISTVHYHGFGLASDNVHTPLFYFNDSKLGQTEKVASPLDVCRMLVGCVIFKFPENFKIVLE